MREVGYYWIKTQMYDDHPPDWRVCYWCHGAFYQWRGDESEHRFYESDCLEIDERRIIREDLTDDKAKKWSYDSAMQAPRGSRLGRTIEETERLNDMP